MSTINYEQCFMSHGKSYVWSLNPFGKLECHINQHTQENLTNEVFTTLDLPASAASQKESADLQITTPNFMCYPLEVSSRSITNKSPANLLFYHHKCSFVMQVLHWLDIEKVLRVKPIFHSYRLFCFELSLCKRLWYFVCSLRRKGIVMRDELL